MNGNHPLLSRAESKPNTFPVEGHYRSFLVFLSKFLVKFALCISHILGWLNNCGYKDWRIEYKAT